jgi:hypothetical protein
MLPQRYVRLRPVGKRSGHPETDAAIAGLTDAQLDWEISWSRIRAQCLGPLPRKGIMKRIHRLEKARDARLARL